MVEHLSGECRENGTARFRSVSTIIEAASRRQRLNVRKGCGHATLSIPQAQLAHPGRVEHEPPIRQEHQLAMRGRVATVCIVVADGFRRHQGHARERINEGRFADSSRYACARIS